jgi:hypothetical protein
MLTKPPVEALFKQAIANAKSALPEDEPGRTVIKSISAKQRPRRLEK